VHETKNYGDNGQHDRDEQRNLRRWCESKWHDVSPLNAEGRAYHLGSVSGRA
jgi:hypothetical protein